MEISEILKNRQIEKLPRSERADLIGQIYEYYEKSWKKNTWINYISWLKTNRIKNTKENRELFKKSKSFFKKETVKSIASFRLGHIKTKDLYYILSQAKDMDKRGDNFNKWLFYSLKANETNNNSTTK